MVAMPEGGIQVTSHSRLLIPGHFLFPTLGKLSSAIYGRAAPWANPKPFYSISILEDAPRLLCFSFICTARSMSKRK